MATDPCDGLPVYEIEKISGDNWRPGMKYREGFLVRYRRHPDFGWTGCRAFPDMREAVAFAQDALDASGNLKG